MKSTVREIKIKVPEDVLLSASISEKQLVNEMREVLAFKLFSEGRLSGGTAAKLAGMPRVTFLLNCHRYGASTVVWDREEIEAEFKDALS